MDSQSLITFAGHGAQHNHYACGKRNNQQICGGEKIDKSDTKGGLFYDDHGYPDLSQIQLISWTVIGIGIFLLKTLSDVIGSSGAVSGLPDIDQTLLMLMGIGQGAYIGKKIITKDASVQ